MKEKASMSIFQKMSGCNHHHHNVVLIARISLTLAIRLYHAFFPAGLSGCVLNYVLAGHPTLARQHDRVHWRTLLMSWFLLLQQCPACLVRLIWMVFEMDGRWPYRCCFVGCCFQDLFNIARSILVQLLSSFIYIYIYIYIYICSDNAREMHSYTSMYMMAAWKIGFYFFWFPEEELYLVYQIKTLCFFRHHIKNNGFRIRTKTKSKGCKILLTGSIYIYIYKYICIWLFTHT